MSTPFFVLYGATVEVNIALGYAVLTYNLFFFFFFDLACWLRELNYVIDCSRIWL